MEGTQKILSDMLDIMQSQQSEINELKKEVSSSVDKQKDLKVNEVSPLMKEYLSGQAKR